jgi:hypothetical protein
VKQLTQRGLEIILFLNKLKRPSKAKRKLNQNPVTAFNDAHQKQISRLASTPLKRRRKKHFTLKGFGFPVCLHVVGKIIKTRERKRTRKSGFHNKNIGKMTSTTKLLH